jgi:hypothetical protein
LQPLHSRIAKVAYSEEFCEAMLSRFSARWAEHPTVQTIDALSDLFVSLPDLLHPVTSRMGTISVTFRIGSRKQSSC